MNKLNTAHIFVLGMRSIYGNANYTKTDLIEAEALVNDAEDAFYKAKTDLTELSNAEMSIGNVVDFEGRMAAMRASNDYEIAKDTFIGSSAWLAHVEGHLARPQLVVV